MHNWLREPSPENTCELILKIERFCGFTLECARKLELLEAPEPKRQCEAINQNGHRCPDAGTAALGRVLCWTHLQTLQAGGLVPDQGLLFEPFEPCLSG